MESAEDTIMNTNNEGLVELELNLGKELANKLTRQNKKELLNHVLILILKCRVQQETIQNLEQEHDVIIKRNQQRIIEVHQRNDVLAERLDKAESYIEQGRGMITSIMEQWYKYD